MATLREEAQAYIPPQTLNIADLDKIGDYFKQESDKELKKLMNYNKALFEQNKIFQNPNAVEILNIIGQYKHQTITQLQEKLGLKTFNNTFLNVRKLEKAGLLKTSKDYKAQGRPVTVSLTPLDTSFSSPMALNVLGGVYYQCHQQMTEETKWQH